MYSEQEHRQLDLVREKVKSLPQEALNRRHNDCKVVVPQYNLEFPTWKQLVGVDDMGEQHKENEYNLHQSASVYFGP